MSRMADFDAELREAGIDPERVDLERVDRYRKRYQAETGREIPLLHVAGILYWLGEVRRFGK